MQGGFCLGLTGPDLHLLEPHIGHSMNAARMTFRLTSSSYTEVQLGLNLFTLQKPCSVHSAQLAYLLLVSVDTGLVVRNFALTDSLLGWRKKKNLQRS